MEKVSSLLMMLNIQKFIVNVFPEDEGISRGLARLVC